MDRNYDNFAKTFSKSRNNLKRGELDYFVSFLKSLSIENPSILDIGCGNGRLLDSIVEIGIGEYLGIDSSGVILNEAKNNHPDNVFQKIDMLDIDKIDKKYDLIFFIASYHHLETYEQRNELLGKTYKLLKEGGYIFMTNWALNSDLNKLRYKKSIIENSSNQFGSIDYDIKIGKFSRFYHCFELNELKSLFLGQRFDIIENKLFENKKNIVSIVKKVS